MAALVGGRVYPQLPTQEPVIATRALWGTSDGNALWVATENTVLRIREDASGAVVGVAACSTSMGRSTPDRFRDEVAAQQHTDKIHLLFNNAGIGGGGSFVSGDRAEWDRTFAVCWGGVYHCSRAFVPLLVKSDDAYLINTSSVNGFWACLGTNNPHTAYSSAKFAVKGFSEALITDFKVNAPHVKVAVVMPGHIGTDIVTNTWREHGGATPELMSAEQLDDTRTSLVKQGMPVKDVTDDQLDFGRNGPVEPRA